MAKNKKDDKKKEDKPRVHKDLEGLDIRINSFGEVVSNFDMDKINKFLDKNVEDKKLEDREGEYGDKQKPKGEDDEENEK